MSIPFTFAQPFAPGDVPAGSIVQLRTKSGTIIPTQQDQESTWQFYNTDGTINTTNANNGSYKTVAISALLPDTFAGRVQISSISWNNGTVTVNTVSPISFGPGQLVNINGVSPIGFEGTFVPTVVSSTQFSYPLAANPGASSGSPTATNMWAQVTVGYDIWAVPGAPNRTPNVTLSQLSTNNDIKLICTGYDLGGDQWQCRVNDIIAGGSNWPWRPNPTWGYEVIRSGPLCTEWRFWACLRRISDGAIHPWARAVLFVRAWGAGGPYEIGGYLVQCNLYSHNPGSTVSSGGISTSNTNDLLIGAYRFANTSNPSAGSGWNASAGSGQNYQLTEYQIVSTVQINVVPPIGTGSGDQSAGIGDAIQQAAGGALALDAAVHMAAQTGTSATVSLTTTKANDVVVVVVVNNDVTVSNISSPHLGNLTLRKRVQANNGNYFLEEWYAVATSTLSNETITITMSGSSSAIIADVLAISGANASAPFDPNSSLPANLAAVGSSNPIGLHFVATLQNGNTVLSYFGGPNDPRTLSVDQASAVNTGNSTIAISAAQSYSLLGVSVKGIDTQPGGPCVYLSSSGTMPSGLAANTPYVVTCNQSLGDGWNNQELAFSPTRGDAFNNNIIAISSTGSGTLTITPAIYLMPWLPIPLMDTDGHRVWALGTKPTLLSAPDFVYLTTKSRMMQPYLVGTPVDHNACLLQPYGTLGPDYLAPFSQGAFYEPANIGGYGETPISDRIGWLSHSQAVELYRPLDLEAVQFCRNAAWAWMELSPVLGDERYGGVHPVVNETQYSNYPTPVGPGVFWSTDSRNTFPVNKGSEVVNVDLGGAHNPCPHILPYLKTGDFLHYESLAYYCNARFLNSIWGAFTAGTVTAYKPWCCIAYPNNNYNPGGTIDATSFDSSNIVQGNWDYGDGIQVRGVGWMGRIQSVMTHFMPDNRPEAQYFRDMHRGIFTLPNQVTQYIPTEFANLGALGAVVNNGYSNTYTVYGLYFHYIMFLCWAVEAWKGEYPDLVNFVCNYLSRGPLGIANDRWPPYGPGGQGCIFAGQLYHYVVADPTDSTRFGTWDQALANSYLSPVNQWDIGTISGSTVTSAHGVSSFANFQNSPTVFVNTLNFNDFPAYTQVAHGGEGGGTSFSLIPLEGSSGNAQAAVARSTYTAPTSVAAGVGATTLQFSASAFPGGVLVGMAACNQSNIASLPVGSLNVMNQGGAIIPSFVTAINSSGGTVTISLSEPIGQFSGQGINAGDTILFGPAIVFSLTPMPWPGVAAVATAGGVKDMGDNNFGANYYDARSYFCFLTSCLGMADTLFRQTGNANLAIASNAYTEIRRRQYLGFPPGINSPLAFNNNPRWGVGPIGATS